MLGEVGGRCVPETADHGLPFLPYGLPRADGKGVDAALVIAHMPLEIVVQKGVQPVVRTVKTQHIVAGGMFYLVIVRLIFFPAAAADCGKQQRPAERHGQNLGK